jgi:hypothetical protein
MSENYDASNDVIEVYQHPQGKRITVFADETFECKDADGKKRPTSATLAKLRAGHGRWERVV